MCRSLHQEFRTNEPDVIVHPLLALAMLACAPRPALAQEATAAGADVAAGAATSPTVVTEDVERFYRIYDAAGGKPTAEQLQRDYLDPGSEGLHQFARVRRITGARIADMLGKQPELYADARRCIHVLPQVQQRLSQALHTLGELYPDVEDRFVHVIAHEYAHVQLAPETANLEKPTVLERSLVEGAAEFAAELTSGNVAYSHFDALTRGREEEIETAFKADMDKTDTSAWLDNSSVEEPGDLGYWVGCRIAKAYYQRASDKRQALREILRMQNPKAFLAESGWYPGIQFQEWKLQEQ
jgi:hypothetical protein